MLALTVEPAQIVVGILVGAVAFLLAWFLLGSAARQKQDRERAQRMRAVIQPGQQQGGAAAANPQSGRVDPRQRHQVRDALRRVSWVQRTPRRRARGRRGVAAFGRVRGGVRPRGAGVRRARRGAPAQPASGAGRGCRRRRIPNAAACGARSSKRAEKLREQLPDVLTIMASSLRAGHSFLQSLDTVAKEIAHPAAAEFQRVVAEIRLGRPGRGRARVPRRARGESRTSCGPCSRSTSSGRSAGTSPRSSTPSPTRCASARCCDDRSRCSPRRVDSRHGCWVCCRSGSRCTCSR